MKFQCSRSAESNGNTACCRCSGERLFTNAEAASAIALDDRSEPITAPPTRPTRKTPTRTRRGERSSFISDLQGRTRLFRSTLYELQSTILTEFPITLTLFA